AEDPRRGGLRSPEPASRRDGDARDSHLHRLRLVRRRRVEVGGHRGGAEAGGDGAVASHGHPQGLSDGRQRHRTRRGRSRRQLLRELRVRLAAQLHRLLRRARDEDDRRAVPGARRAKACRARGADPAEARGGRRAARHGLAPRLLPDGAVREEPRPAPQPLQLRADARSVAGPLAMIDVMPNIPEVVAEVRELFERYEQALIDKNVDVLDATFWNSTHTIRYAFHENGYGFDEIHAHRVARPPGPGTKERRIRLEILTLGRDLATVNLEFKIRGRDQVGRQSQTWVRFPDVGWKVIAAHVSVMDMGGSGRPP